MLVSTKITIVIIVNMIKISMLVFWVITQCGLVGRYQRLGGTYCLHHQG
jgi:hypothetical protein